MLKLFSTVGSEADTSNNSSPNERILTSLFDYMLNFIKDFQRMLHMDTTSGKKSLDILAEHLYKVCTDIYLLRTLLVICQGIDKKLLKTLNKDAGFKSMFSLVQPSYDLVIKGDKEVAGASQI